VKDGDRTLHLHFPLFGEEMNE